MLLIQIALLILYFQQVFFSEWLGLTLKTKFL